MAKVEEASSKRTGQAVDTGPVLVGYDGSEGGHDALELARMIAEVGDTRAAIATGLLYGPVSVNRALSEEENAGVEPLFEEARAALGDSEAEAHVIGSRAPARMLVDCASRIDASTIVVGAPHLSALGRTLLSSVAERVLHHADREVAIAPHGYASKRHQGLAKIAVAFDGTPEAEAALRRAEALAHAAGASVEILVAEDPVVVGLEDEVLPKHARSAAEVMEKAMATVDPSLSPSGQDLDVGWREMDRSIAVVIAEACGSDVDLLVTGSRSRGPAGRFLMGTVTNHLATMLPCPMLIVPRPTEG